MEENRQWVCGGAKGRQDKRWNFYVKGRNQKIPPRDKISATLGLDNNYVLSPLFLQSFIYFMYPRVESRKGERSG